MKMRNAAALRLLCGAASAGCAMLLVSDRIAQGATLRWDGGGANVGWTDAANWNNGGSDATVTSGDTLLFDNTFVTPLPTPVAVNATMAIASLTLNTANNVDIRSNVAPTTTSRTLTINGDGSAANYLINAQGGGLFSFTSQNTTAGSSTLNISTSSSGTIFVGTGTTLTHSNGNNFQVSAGNTITVTGGGTLLWNGTSGGMAAGTTLVLNQGTLRASQLAIGSASLNLGGAGGVTLTSETSSSLRTYSGVVQLHDSITFGATGFGPMLFGGATTLTSNVNLNTSMTGGTGSTTFSGGIDDGINTFGINKGGGNSLALTGVNTYGGGTTVNAGTFSISGTAANTSGLAANAGSLVIDLSTNAGANPTDVINNAATLALREGTVTFIGKNSGVSSQTLGTVSFTPGASTIRLSNASSVAGAMNLTLSNTWNRSTGAVTLIDLSSAGSKTLTSSPTLTNGVLGYAVVRESQYRFATVVGGNVTGFTTATTLAASSDSASTNFVTTSGVTHDTVPGWSANSLELANTSNITVNLGGGVLTLTSGGVLFSRNGGAPTITNGQIGATDSEVIFHIYNTVGAAQTMNVSATVSGGTGSLTKTGLSSSLLVLTSNNTYTGNTYVTGGALQVGSGGTTGSIAGNVVLSNGASFGLAHSNDENFTGTISGNGMFFKTTHSASTLTLSAANTHTGGVSIANGKLVIANDSALGTGQLQLASANNTVTLTSTTDRNFTNSMLIGTNGSATAVIDGESGLMSFSSFATGNSGVRTLQVDAYSVKFASHSGTTTNNTWVFNKTGGGAMIVTGNSDYQGQVTVGAGTYAVGGAINATQRHVLAGGGVLATNGNFTRSLGSGNGNIQWLGSGGLAAYGANGTWGGAGNNLNVNIGGAGATLSWGDLNFLADGQSLNLGSRVANGTVTISNGLGLGSSTRTIDVTRSDTAAASNVDAVISGQITSGVGGALTKDGQGVLSLTANNSFDSGVVVASGTLLVNNTSGYGITTPGVLIQSGGKLGGSGSVDGSLQVQGTLAPGNSTGVLTVDDNVTFQAIGSFEAEVNGYTAGSGYDQLRVTGVSDVVITGALSISMGAFTGSEGTLIYLIDNSSTGLTNGSFFGYAEGAEITSLAGVNGMNWFITYDGDKEADSQFNDVAIYGTAVPEPTGLSALALGAGGLLRRRRRR